MCAFIASSPPAGNICTNMWQHALNCKWSKITSYPRFCFLDWRKPTIIWLIIGFSIAVVIIVVIVAVSVEMQKKKGPWGVPLMCPNKTKKTQQKKSNISINLPIYFFSWKDKRYELCNQQRVLFFKELFGKTNCLWYFPIVNNFLTIGTICFCFEFWLTLLNK